MEEHFSWCMVRGEKGSPCPVYVTPGKKEKKIVRDRKGPFFYSNIS